MIHLNVFKGRGMNRGTSRSFPRLWMLGLLLAGLGMGSAAPCHAEEGPGSLGLNVYFPAGVGVRYFLEERSALEARGQFEKDIKVGGLRLYHFFEGSQTNIHVYGGLEADYVSFTGSPSKGDGVAGEVFLGGEYFFARSLSAQFDFGPAYVMLKDTRTSLGVSGLDLVLNLAINIYFGSSGSRGGR